MRANRDDLVQKGILLPDSSLDLIDHPIAEGKHIAFFCLWFSYVHDKTIFLVLSQKAKKKRENSVAAFFLKYETVLTVAPLCYQNYYCRRPV